MIIRCSTSASRRILCSLGPKCCRLFIVKTSTLSRDTRGAIILNLVLAFIRSLIVVMRRSKDLHERHDHAEHVSQLRIRRVSDILRWKEVLVGE